MGMDADVIAIGPFEVLRSAGCLDYPLDFYEDVETGDVVLGTVALAYTTGQSQILAEICGVEPWALGKHRVGEPKTPSDPKSWIGDDSAWTVYERLENLMREDTQVYFRPNG